jgi:hypothetical protein
MNSEGRAEYRLKKAGDNYMVMEHVIRGDNKLARRRDHGMQYRQQIHTIGGGGGGGGGLGNFNFGKRLQ